MLGVLARKATCVLDAARKHAHFVHYREAHWWQPVLPALASIAVPHALGKGNRRKKMQQKAYQIICMHARRKEGTRRNQILRKLAWQKHLEKIRGVYREYGELLRRKAVENNGGGLHGPGRS